MPRYKVTLTDAERQELLALTGDTGGKTVRDANPEACLAMKPKHPKLFRDIDVKGDYDGLTDS